MQINVKLPALPRGEAYSVGVRSGRCGLSRRVGTLERHAERGVTFNTEFDVQPPPQVYADQLIEMMDSNRTAYSRSSVQNREGSENEVGCRLSS